MKRILSSLLLALSLIAPASAQLFAPIFSLQRVVPTGLPALPLKLLAVYGPGAVATSPSSAITAAQTTLASSYTGATDCTINPTTGVDTTAGSNKNFATVGFFLRTDTLCSYAVATTDFTTDVSNIRVSATDASQIGVAKTINGADSLGGLIRIQTSTVHGYITGQKVVIQSVGGTTEANGTWSLTVTDTTHFTLDGSTFVNAYTSGGTATNQIPRLKIFSAGTHSGGGVIFRTTVPDITAAVFTQDVTNTNVYCTANAYLSSSAAVTRVMRSDVTESVAYPGGTLTLPTQLKKNSTSMASLNAETTVAWWWDSSANKKLCIIPYGTTIGALQPFLSNLVLETGGTSRILVQGGDVGIEGVRLEGVQFVSIDQNGRPPSIWSNNNIQLWPTAKGWDPTNSGRFIETYSLCYASQADCRNGFAPSVNGSNLFQTANSRYIYAGDTRVFALDGTLQGLSMHGCTHNVSFGSVILNSNGSGVADTSTNGCADVTWIVAGDVGPQANTSAVNMQFGTGGTTGLRSVWFDQTRVNKGAASIDLGILNDATAKAYQTTFPVVSGTAPTAYTPSAP